MKMKWMDKWGHKYRKKHRIADDSPYSNKDFLLQEISAPFTFIPRLIYNLIWGM